MGHFFFFEDVLLVTFCKCYLYSLNTCFLCSEIQLKTPNWLFGQKKYEESGSASKAVKSEIENGASCKEIDVDGYSELNLLSSVGDINEEDIFQRYFYILSSHFPGRIHCS